MRTGSAAACPVAAWMRGVFGGEGIHIYVWRGPFTVYLKLSQYRLLIDYTSTQNKKHFKRLYNKYFSSVPTNGCSLFMIIFSLRLMGAESQTRWEVGSFRFCDLSSVQSFTCLHGYTHAQAEECTICGCKNEVAHLL